MQHTKITMQTYELLKYAIPAFNRLPRSQKFTLGDRMQHILSDILEKLIEASYVPPSKKKVILPEVNLLLEKFRFYNRLTHELGYFSIGQYQEIARRIDEIGRMAGGWLKSL